jgi:LPS sulfotransferase NodH
VVKETRITITPSVSYLVCGTNRSGSNLLGGLLKSTGVAGRPEEYFWRGHEADWAERWGASDPAEYVRAAIEAGTTPNGVFGAKLMWPHMDDLLAKVSVISEDRRESALGLLDCVFPNLRFIWIWREDMVAQAVSFSRAIQTDEWTAGVRNRPGGEPRFDFKHIRALHDEVIRQNRAWRRWFELNGIAPTRVRYEDLVDDMEAVTFRVLDSLGVEVPPGTTPEAKHSKQADAISAEWISRYRAEAGSSS